MNSKEREVFYRLLINLFLDHPSRRKQAGQPGSKQKRVNNHESIPTNARRPE
ncbi:hypothetical protein KSD_31220 [Ktedonobacter sp. SOSP1-85]|uniref:hypothetical protein n=1 Tax=Ktedonobacter sp. SOSP1-85 TaxID=2778367 RepID=UPI001914F7DE|nr:hypothetical protein [Ktedonobacter sp. SOSP1-85]GHO75351.1 hypothetical protein KSD_31220 [Ktedonobacter sp. SOSP1-85]